MAGYTYRQDFRWHDAAGNYDYQFGEDGYMVLDGSRQVVQCRRDLVRGITDSGGAVEFAARMTMGVPGQGDSYEIRICGGDGRPMACLHISRSDGKIRTRGPSGLVDTGAVLSFQGGRSFSDASTHKWYVVDSDEHVFRFDAFDFGAGRMRFRLDDGEPVWIPFSADGGDAARFELRTTEVGVGRRIRLRRVTQYSGREVLDAEAFPVHWRPVPAPADGMPDDNVCESLLRPVDGRWLEITTLYGFVTATVPSIPRGTVEFDLMVPDVNQEACIILGEADGTMKAFRKIQTGILTGRFVIAPKGGGYHAFDDPISPEDDRSYRFRISWDRATNKQRIWIDGVPQRYGGTDEIAIYGDWSRPKHLANGIDTISLHPGQVGTVRLTSIQRAQRVSREMIDEPFRSYWGGFRLEAE